MMATAGPLLHFRPPLSLSLLTDAILIVLIVIDFVVVHMLLLMSLPMLFSISLFSLGVPI